MKNHTKLAGFDLKVKKDGKLLCLVSGIEAYYISLKEAFPHLRFSKRFEDDYNGYDWAAFIYHVPATDQEMLEGLLTLLRRVVMINDGLSQTFALDYHKSVYGGKMPRTEIGQLVYASKYKQTLQTSANIDKLTKYFADFILLHPSYYRARFIVSPPHDKPSGSNLPQIIVERLCATIGKQNGNDFLKKVKKTLEMKAYETLHEKIENIQGAFSVLDGHPFEGETVIILDDVYESGATLHELATELEAVGANVLGLVGTKTLRNPR